MLCRRDSSLKLSIILLVWLGVVTPAHPQDSTLAPALRALPGAYSVSILPALPGFAGCYELLFRQPLDHQRPDGASFLQRVYVSHVSPDRPTVLETEGYAAPRNHATELAGLLNANQVLVEHRFFGRSRPDSLLWRFLTLKQSADDLHAIVTALKQLYTGKWVSTGTSKGGQTTLLYRYYYPGDVDASIPYVAPIPLAQEDSRVLTFLSTVGDSSCRSRIREFQIRMLRNEGAMMPRFEEFAKSASLKFSVGAPVAFEYAVLEYPFAFWQYGASACDKIPDSATADEEAFKHLARVVPFYLFSDAGVEFFAPFFYQAYSELGYYRYDITDFRSLLKHVTDATNRIWVPRDATVVYHCETMQNIHRWLQTEGNNIIYLYGETDTWTACAVQLTGQTNALKIVHKGGPHGTRIKDLLPGNREIILSTLERWLDMRIQR